MHIDRVYGTACLVSNARRLYVQGMQMSWRASHSASVISVIVTMNRDSVYVLNTNVDSSASTVSTHISYIIIVSVLAQACGAES